MYAAAGGASLASRQARQRQRQQKKTQALQAKLHPPKASVLSVAEHGASTPTRSTSRQFHQLPTGYLRAPQPHGRKLSASYTAQSKLLLPIDEGDTQSVLHMRMHSHGGLHPHAHSHSHGPHAAAQLASHTLQHPHQHHHHGRVSPKLTHRHSGSGATGLPYVPLPKSATATLPLVSQMEATPPATPSGAAAAAGGPPAESIALPCQDSIIVTPATPMASPGHVAKLRDAGADDDLATAAEKQPLTAAEPPDDDDEPMEPPPGPLERKCSVYRMRRSDAADDAAEAGKRPVHFAQQLPSPQQHQLQQLQSPQQQQYEPLLPTDEPQLMFKGMPALPPGRKWQVCAYCEEGICVCEHIECAQGRAAWLERSRRCSVQESAQQAAACHRRWVKRNRIQDASLGGSSDDEDFLGVLRGPSTFANAFLYVGLGTIALGLVIAFVGTGEKGFKTVELRLIGPSMIGLGLICCILRILFCICPSHCISSSKKKTRKKNAGNKVDADHTTSLLRSESKRVSIARGPVNQPRYPMTHRRSQNKMLNEGMEALRQIATTSLFMQNEQKTSMNRVVPIIKEPDTAIEAPLEMKKLETALNMCEVSDEEDEDDDHIQTATVIEMATQAPTTTNNTTTGSGSNRRAPFAAAPSSGSAKLTRQRTALQQQTIESQSQSLSSSSTVKDDDEVDGAAAASAADSKQMETSLMVIGPPPPLAAEARPPAPPAPFAPTATTTKTPPPPYATAATTSTPSSAYSSSIFSSMSRTTSTGLTTPATASASAAGRMPTSATAPSLPPPPHYTGAIPRVSSAGVSSTLYDLPPLNPHSYAASPASSRSSNMERDHLIRGPLGMPFSALNAYHLPSTPSKKLQLAAAASSAATAKTSPPTTATTIGATPAPPANPVTTISLLPLPPVPSPPASITTTAAAAAQQPASSPLPGQVIEGGSSSSSTSTSTPTSYLAAACQRPASTGSGGGGAAAMPYTSIAATTSSLNSAPTPSLLQQAAAAAAAGHTSTPGLAAAAAAATAFQFPTPLSAPSTASSSQSSAPSTANGLRATAAGATGPLATPPPAAASSSATLGAKFEPELLLSPAKLGQ